MLPGVSSIDYMFADLELEPGLHGCTIHAATDLLAHNRQLNPSAHNIILQVGNVGSATLEKEVTVSYILCFSLPYILEHLTGVQVPATRRSPGSGFWTRSQGGSLFGRGSSPVI